MCSSDLVDVSWGVASFKVIDNLHESEPIQLRPIEPAAIGEQGN